MPNVYDAPECTVHFAPLFKDDTGIDGFSLVFITEMGLDRLESGPFTVRGKDVIDLTDKLSDTNTWFISGVNWEFEDDDNIQWIYSVYDRYVTSIIPEGCDVYRARSPEELLTDVVLNLHQDLDECDEEKCVLTEFIRVMNDQILSPLPHGLERYVFEHMRDLIEAIDSDRF